VPEVEREVFKEEAEEMGGIGAYTEKLIGPMGARAEKLMSPRSRRRYYD